MKKIKLLVVIGTRPEAIKLASIIAVFQQQQSFELKICITGQHQEMLGQMLEFFAIKPDFNLALMKPNQSLSSLTAAAIPEIDIVLQTYQPDWIIVQGDTTTAFICALIAFYHKIQVVHIEAGLRTYNPHSPWPEEINRRLISELAAVHYAPTQSNANNLIAERIPTDKITVTGNTVIDTLMMVVKRINHDSKLKDNLNQQFNYLDPRKRLILVTGHRRENHENGLGQLCQALLKIAERDDVEIIYPVHLNPQVQKIAYPILNNYKNIYLIAPLDYVPFVYLLQRCELVITDSGGVQEEAPSLGKPVLITRNTTERYEGVTAGTAILAGTEMNKIISLTHELLDNPAKYLSMSHAHNPYGDGQASQRIAYDLLQRCVVEHRELV